jgi:ParB/RepB/Spo0J family partition protein
MNTTLKPDVAESTRETQPVTSNAAKGMQENAATAKSVKVNLDDVYISKQENIRSLGSYTDESIGEMAAQIEAVGGLLQPIGIVKVKASPDTDNKQLMLVWGCRRAFALEYLAESDPKWKIEVPARLVDKGLDTTGATRILQLMENKARRDLNPVETALAINEALNDKDCDFNQQDIARMLGMSTPAISQHLKLLRFPKPVQEAISSGNLPFSHAREILSRVPETDWVNTAKKASGMIYSAFIDYLDKEWPKSDGDGNDGDGTVTEAGKKDSSQKAAKMLRATDVTNKYVPFLKKQIEQADKETKSYTAADVAQARLDTVNTILLNSDTQLSKDIDPFLKEIQAKEEEEKANEQSTKAEHDFFKKLVKRIEELYVPTDPKDPDTRPRLAQVMAQVGKETFAMKPEDKAKLGFKLTDNPDTFVQQLDRVYRDVLAERVESKKKRDEAKAKKLAEEKAAGGAPTSAA